MDSGTEEIKTIVYDLMNGNFDLSLYCPEEASWVENEFDIGKPCETLYKNVYKASKRLSDRLGKKGKEDEDVETIISCLIAIGKLQSMKMFDYGVQFAEKKVKEESLTNN